MLPTGPTDRIRSIWPSFRHKGRFGRLPARAHVPQLPVPRVGNPGPGRGIGRPAGGLLATRGLWRLHTARLAVATLLLLRREAGVITAWIFNIWCTLDLLNAFYQGNAAGLPAGQLGATYFIPNLVLLLLLITHGLAFRILLQPEREPLLRQSLQPA